MLRNTILCSRTINITLVRRIFSCILQFLMLRNAILCSRTISALVLYFMNDDLRTLKRNIVRVSAIAETELKDYLCGRGFEISEFGPIAGLPDGIACHPDLVYCRLFHGDNTAFESNSPIKDLAQLSSITGSIDRGLFRGDARRLSADYPEDIIYNACSTGKYFLHNLKYTAPELLAAAKAARLELIDIPQGYAKCSIAVVSENAIITYDRGIAAAIEATGGKILAHGNASGSALSANLHKTMSSHIDFAKTNESRIRTAISVLLIEPGHINLPGYNTGFIGGCTGLDFIHNELIFNGDLSLHPDGDRIREFVESHGVTIKDFPGRPLTDIGSIIF